MEMNLHKLQEIVKDRQGILACRSPWCCRVGHDLATKQQKTTQVIYMHIKVGEILSWKRGGETISVKYQIVNISGFAHQKVSDANAQLCHHSTNKLEWLCSHPRYLQHQVGAGFGLGDWESQAYVVTSKTEEHVSSLLCLFLLSAYAAPLPSP